LLCTRKIASPNNSATDNTVVLNPPPTRWGTLSVVISSSIGELFNRSSPCSVIKLCVTAAMIRLAPRDFNNAAALVKVPAVVVKSSTNTTLRPSTSPTTLMASTSVALFRCLPTIAKPALNMLE